MTADRAARIRQLAWDAGTRAILISQCPDLADARQLWATDITLMLAEATRLAWPGTPPAALTAATVLTGPVPARERLTAIAAWLEARPADPAPPAVPRRRSGARRSFPGAERSPGLCARSGTWAAPRPPGEPAPCRPGRSL